MNNYTPAKKSQTVAKPVDNLVQLIQQYQPQIKAALPKHITPERMTRIIMTEVRNTPKLAECNTASFFGAVLQCSQLGLEPGVGLGHAYLLPYGKDVQLIIGYQGMIDLAERSGKITMDAHVVYKNDKFEYTLGLDPSMEHKPATEDPGEVIAAYAIARYSDGRFKFRVLSKPEIEEAKKSSPSGKRNSGPWSTHYSEMARKTAIKRLFKMLPKSPEMARAQEIEDNNESGVVTDFKVNIDQPEIIEAETDTAVDDLPFGEEAKKK